VSNGYGCYDTIVKKNFITVWPKPLADFTFGPQPTDIYESEIEFMNHTIGGNTYDWTFGDGGTSTEVNPVHMYADSGKYPVTLYVENQYGCKDTTMRVVVIDPVVAVYIPNAFTPDKDGRNETFFLKGYGIVEEGFQFMIFNRWGEMIYYTEKFQPWDGTVNGEPAPQGVYVYRFIFKDILDRTHDKIGSVTLIR
jgi:gliding motility-associated-like protein